MPRFTHRPEMHRGTDDAALNADDTPIVDSGNNFTSTHVEGALAELADRTAVDVPITDGGGYFSSTEVEGALQELGGDVAAVPAFADLLIGNDRYFGTTLGNWTNSGGTATWDGTNKYTWPVSVYSSGTLKFETDNDGQYVQVAVPGTFLAGVEYQAFLAFNLEEVPTPDVSYLLTILFGELGTDESTSTILGYGSPWTDAASAAFFAHSGLQVIRWTPSADRSDVHLRFRRDSEVAEDLTFHIAHARVVRGVRDGEPGLGLALIPSSPPYGRNGPALVVENTVNGVFLYALGSAFGLAGSSVGIGETGVSIQDVDALQQVSVYPDQVYVAAGHAPGDLVQKGLNIEVGDDYIGLFIGEKDADTVQFYGDFGDYDFELADGATRGWYSRDANDVERRFANMVEELRLPFAWNTASISTGVTIATLAAGDVVLGAWIDVATAWNSVVSDAGDIITATSSDSLLSGTVNMQSVPAGTDRRKLRSGTVFSGEASVMVSGMDVRVKVTSTGGSLSTGAGTAILLISRA